MVFSSAVFIWLFLPVVFIINLILPKKCSNIFLLIASLFFYAWGEPFYVLLMIGTIIVNYLAGILISRNDAHKATILAGTIVVDIAILGYFKYANFFVDTVNSLFGRQVITPPGILLPIGISFFTFQAISYVVDVYRGDTKASKSIINVALYISFFPQLIAGPIVKYKEINKQVESRTVNADCMAMGFRTFIYGLGKKVIIANILGKSVDIVYDLPLESFGTKTIWFVAFMYVLQLYYDFSGYSDMAIGLGKMFGFDIPRNFNYPFLSRSIAEHWRRWHISLGTWFREYVYIPLGGNRKGNARTYINNIAVFMLTGMWHGASMSYIAWGAYNAFFVVIERAGLSKKLEKSKIFSHVYYVVVTVVGFVIFRVNNLRRSVMLIIKMFMLPKLFDSEYALGNYMNGATWFVLFAAVLGCGILQKAVPSKLKEKWNNSMIEFAYLAVVLVISLSLVANSTYNPFIYFQF